MELTGEHFLGQARSRRGSSEFQAVDPVTGEALSPTCVDATTEEIDEALQAAVQAQAGMKALSRAARAEFLERIAEEIEALGDELLHRGSAETALPLPRLTMERGRTVGQLRMFASVLREGSYLDVSIDHAEPEREPLPKPDLRRMQIPIGPVVVFGASNFPLAYSVAGGDTASALAAGCPVIVKAHPHHPGTSELVGHAILAAIEALGLPPCFSLLHGVSHEVGQKLVEHPDVAAIGFTGSFAGGKAIFDAAVARPVPIPVHAEMGSTNPVFFLPGALAENGVSLATGLAQSVALGVGQFCTNPGIVVLLDDPAGECFIETLTAEMAAAPQGTMLHAGIAAAWRAGLARLEAIVGVELRGEPADDGACSARPTLLMTDAATFLERPELREELFGPGTLVVRCATREQVMAVANSFDGQLTACVHGTESDLQDFGGLIPLLEERAGRLLLGGFPTGVEVCSAMLHGGPFPATTDVRSSSVGPSAISRWLRPISYQNFPERLLPVELRDSNPEGILRIVDGQWGRD